MNIPGDIDISEQRFWEDNLRERSFVVTWIRTLIVNLWWVWFYYYNTLSLILLTLTFI